VYDLFDDALSVGTYTGLNLTGALTYGTATGTRLVSANATITTGTITTAVIPSLTAGTTTSTAATITSGTVTNLASTTGTIATLNSTTGTIATLNSTTGTIPTLVATTLITTATGTAAAPAIVPTGDTNTGIFFPAADTIAFAEGGTEGMRIDSSGNVGIGQTPINSRRLTISTTGQADLSIVAGSTSYGQLLFGYTGADNKGIVAYNNTDNSMQFYTNSTERLRIDSSGNLLVGKTAPSTSTVGFQFSLSDNKIACGAASGPSAFFNRNTDDGIIVQIAQDGTVEGTISVSGTTVSYNGGHLSRFSQLPSGQRDPAIKKGTVLSNLDAMCEWRDADGSLLPNEQLNKVKISDVEGDSNTAGVFVNWDNDDQDNPYDLNMAMTGDMIIRIAQGTSVNRGDLLMSAGDGTAKPQGDDIIRSKTIAKVTSTNVTCTYEDGSYCVPCVLMAC